MSDTPWAALVALLVVAVLVLVMRWVFAPSRPGRAASRPVDAAQSAELGLLSVIATLPRQDALARRARLGAAGIRSSMSARRDGSFDVLVFGADVDRARQIAD
jgi:hypothetical protein